MKKQDVVENSMQLVRILLDNYSMSEDIAILASKYLSYAKKDYKDITWTLISTSFLMSEGLLKNETIYSLITEKSIYNLYELLEDAAVHDRKLIKLLDYKNEDVSFGISLTEQFYPDYEFCSNIDDYEDNNLYPKKTSFYEDELYFENLDSIDPIWYSEDELRKIYGCNEAIITEGKIDLRKLMYRTRHSIAHSRYEELDESHIRVYHIDYKKKRLVFNIIIDKEAVSTIIDEMNEMFYCVFKDFINNYPDFPQDWDPTKGLNDTNLLHLIKSLNIFGDRKSKALLEQFKKQYGKPIADSEVFNELLEFLYSKIAPTGFFGIIVNNFLYYDGKEITDELWNKLAIYDYLKSDYYQEQYGKMRIVDELKIYILSLLNCTLLGGYNVNDAVGIDSIDFNSLIYDDLTTKNFHLFANQRRLEEKSVLISEIAKIDKEYDKINIFIKEKNEEIKLAIDNQYFKETLPKIIEFSINKLAELSSRKADILAKISLIDKMGSNYRYQEYRSLFSMRYLRNSLAHGNVTFRDPFNSESIEKNDLIFESYQPDDKSIRTFHAVISLGDLLHIILDSEYLKKVFLNDEKVALARKM